MECEYCGELLSDEEFDSPMHDEAGSVMCDACWSDTYEFTCDVCLEYGHVADQHKMLIVWDADEAGVDAGWYRIVSFPYYTASVIGRGWIHRDAVERVDSAPPRLESYYPCGHLCGDCQQQYAAMFSALREMNS